MNDVIRPRRLEFRNVSSAGCQIYADVKFKANCVEFTLKEGMQPVMEMCTQEHRREWVRWEDQMVGHDMWLQFPPEEYIAMKNQLFAEMVDAWNEKYAENDDE